MEKYNAETMAIVPREPIFYMVNNGVAEIEPTDDDAWNTAIHAYKAMVNAAPPVEPVVPISEVLELLDNERQRYYDTEENMKSFAIYDFSEKLKQKYGVSE